MILLLLISITLCYSFKKVNTIKDNKDTKEAINVVTKYFECYNDDKLDFAYQLTTEKQDPFNEFWGPSSYINDVSINKIGLESDPKYMAWYFKILGSKRNYKLNKIKVIRVNYKLKYIPNNFQSYKNGEYNLRYFVVKQDSHSPWKIDYWIDELPNLQ